MRDAETFSTGSQTRSARTNARRPRLAFVRGAYPRTNLALLTASGWGGGLTMMVKSAPPVFHSTQILAAS